VLDDAEVGGSANCLEELDCEPVGLNWVKAEPSGGVEVEEFNQVASGGGSGPKVVRDLISSPNSKEMLWFFGVFIHEVLPVHVRQQLFAVRGGRRRRGCKDRVAAASDGVVAVVLSHR
jgi:hypothetical protein